MSTNPTTPPQSTSNQTPPTPVSTSRVTRSQSSANRWPLLEITFENGNKSTYDVTGTYTARNLQTVLRTQRVELNAQQTNSLWASYKRKNPGYPPAVETPESITEETPVATTSPITESPRSPQIPVSQNTRNQGTSQSSNNNNNIPRNKIL